MKHLSLKNITAACHGVYHGNAELLSKEIAGVAIDSRKIEKDFLFIPIRGERVDGHSFIPQAMEKGALVTLSEKELEAATFPYIKVESTETALKEIAAFYRNALDIKVVGITGSVGKTSTKETIASVLSRKYHVLKTEGNFNNEIGLPLTIFNIREEHQIAVLEMGIDHFGEMHRLASVSQPDICIITNIGLAHLEHLGSRDGILKAKTEVFDHLKSNATVILNGDDDKLCTVSQVQGKSPVFFGLADTNSAWADQIENLGLRGTRCTLHLSIGDLNVHIPVPGSHMIYNALAGACAGIALGLTLDEIKTGIETMKTISGRLNLIDTGSLLIIDDCYNANPVSMKGSLDVLAAAEGRSVAIMGDMFELGDNEKELHYNTGVYAAEKEINVICCIGQLSKETYTGAKAAASKSAVLYFETRDEFLEKINNVVKKGDTILVKASHGMEFPKIVEALKAMELR